jgi:23S rRNA (adenine2503-C2)-methyltransferase
LSAVASSPQLAAPQSPIERLPEEWSELLATWGEPRYRASQVFRWIQASGVSDPEAMSNLPRALRERLAAEGVQPPLAEVASETAGDGTEKLLWALHDGQRIESVLIPRAATHPDDVYAPDATDGDDGSYTLCVSSQVGCAMGCVFCASGLAGLKRNLSAAEIVAQVLGARARLGERGRLAGVVLMGMGEPLHNYDAVARALTLLSHPDGIGMSLRRVTVSTSGLVPQIERLGRDFGGRVGLAVSLHAADSDTRVRLMPIERKHALPTVVDALRRYPLSPRGRITIEYTLVAGMNDDDASATRLAALLGKLRAKVNLIPMNPVPGVSLAAPDEARVDAFAAILRARGLGVFVRRRRGDDIAAACGQLALHGATPRRRAAAGHSEG